MNVHRHCVGLHAQLACVWEATARKPGNVHRYQDFEDASYLDFLTSAAAIAPAFDRAGELSVGELILDTVRRTRAAVHTNTNLGIILLLAPLAKASTRTLPEVLSDLTVRDAELAYEAIRLANPAGLGKVADQDIRTQPTETLDQVMRRAADRDLIALQYTNGFREVFFGCGELKKALGLTGSLESSIIYCHLALLAQNRDSLIARKCGVAVADEASARGTAVFAAGWPHTEAGREAIADFDTWLRADGHRRNPGTTADLVAACLFAALREGIITLPPQVLWTHQGDCPHGTR